MTIWPSYTRGTIIGYNVIIKIHTCLTVITISIKETVVLRTIFRISGFFLEDIFTSKLVIAICINITEVFRLLFARSSICTTFGGRTRDSTWILLSRLCCYVSLSTGFRTITGFSFLTRLACNPIFNLNQLLINLLS